MLKNRAPIQDKIDLRNFKQELGSTVVKRNRVHYISAEELEKEAMRAREEEEKERAYGEFNDDTSEFSQEAIEQADEILARLKREAEADEEAKRLEWERIISEQNQAEAQEKDMLQYYNAATNSYSGAYGQGELEGDARALAEGIMNTEGGVRQPNIEELLKDSGR